MATGAGRVKYPKTFHLPWSQSVSRDDRVLSSLEAFAGQRVIVTEKMDGENTTMYTDAIHARSLASRGHPSRDWVKRLWSQIRHDIPDGWRLCGENLYARHSIHYAALPSYFLGFSLWDESNECLCWDDTTEWLALLGVTPVPVLYDGVFDEQVIRGLWRPSNRESVEGYVVRVACGFAHQDFSRKVGKFVRTGHVQTDEHWLDRPVVPNQLLNL